jgi:hypothetical protein
VGNATFSIPTMQNKERRNDKHHLGGAKRHQVPFDTQYAIALSQSFLKSTNKCPKKTGSLPIGHM